MNLKLEWTTDDRGGYFSNVVEHGACDAKGRSIGGYAHIDCRTRYAVDGTWLDNQPARFFVHTFATRNGEQFGASFNRGTECSTLEEAQALAAKKLAAQGRRFALQVAKGEGKQFARKEGAS